MDKASFTFILFVTLFGFSTAKDNPCKGLWLGEVVANLERCDQYYVCIATRPIPGTCEAGKIFDANTKGCVLGNAETCEIGEVTTTVPTTTPPSTTTTTTPPTTTTSTTTTTPQPPVDLEEICKGVFFSAKPYPNSLSIYVGCIRGRGVLFYCLEDEFFHPVINECLAWPETTTETITTSSLPETTTPVSIEGICDGKTMQYIKYPSKCFLYIFCFEGREYVRQCPEFEIFDIITAKCKYGNQETCEFYPENTNPITEPSPPTTTVEVTTTVEETTVFNPCAGIDNGTVPNPDNCTQFYRCVMQRYIPSQCPDGSVFDRTRLICVSGDPSTCASI
jgi:hypothetical protein